MRTLLPFVKQYKKELILGPFFKLLEAVSELLLPLFMAKLIDQGIRSNNLTEVYHYAFIMLIMTLAGLACVMICQYYASVASQGFGTELREALYKKINQFSYKQLDDYGADTLVTRMTNDINQLQNALAMLIRLVIRAPFLSIGSVIMAFYIHPKTALIFLVTLPIFFLLLLVLMKKTIPLYKKAQAKTDELNRTLQENLMGIRVIRAFAQQSNQTKRVATNSDELAATSLSAIKISTLLNPLTTFIMNIAILLLLYFSGKEVNIGNLQQGEVVALVNYLMQMLLALIVVSNLVVIFTKAATSANRVTDILDLPIEEELGKRTHETIIDTHQPVVLSVDQLSFQYPNQNGWTLTDITFKANVNQTLGIIGATGSGKSSLVQLLPRFYEWQKGHIHLFNQDITSLNLDTLRHPIRLVPQKSSLLSGTIRSNLLFGKNDATEQDMWEALNIAQAKEFVEQLPEQLDAPVSEKGDNFSGGQKQRLAIARGLIAKPALLILDDSLSALDYKTDLQLRQALKQQLPNTTLIIISQRVHSIKQADHILVMDNGQIVGQGNHQTLLNDCATYQAIVASQEQTKEEASYE
ncbi:ABC transporter ATP-binding protein [Vagococcus xieshaowenii]|uniref:ABC transporter ATP-binding protein n=1 Tax=Vagococcus xieshaowenii TaxID=2562451 RepID=A0AAJ5EGT6_9ENTE|nr:ABC transporter ATP-binding protein [Vagococcus xieshaowenii]QCA29235.1 ABC transporter ATP-binding protein [Vagococcus xieshaowenii]TFZ43252.1 ABC transporter ATP-binding protein [Vagococcus xieshaowenii]